MKSIAIRYDYESSSVISSLSSLVTSHYIRGYKEGSMNDTVSSKYSGFEESLILAERERMIAYS